MRRIRKRLIVRGDASGSVGQSSGTPRPPRPPLPSGFSRGLRGFMAAAVALVVGLLVHPHLVVVMVPIALLLLGFGLVQMRRGRT
jgi:hypothetical protein